MIPLYLNNKGALTFTNSEYHLCDFPDIPTGKVYRIFFYASITYRLYDNNSDGWANTHITLTLNYKPLNNIYKETTFKILGAEESASYNCALTGGWEFYNQTDVSIIDNKRPFDVFIKVYSARAEMTVNNLRIYLLPLS